MLLAISPERVSTNNPLIMSIYTQRNTSPLTMLYYIGGTGEIMVFGENMMSFYGIISFVCWAGFTRLILGHALSMLQLHNELSFTTIAPLKLMHSDSCEICLKIRHNCFIFGSCLTIISFLSKSFDDLYSCFLFTYSWIVSAIGEITLTMSKLLKLTPISTVAYDSFHSLISLCLFMFVFQNFFIYHIYPCLSFPFSHWVTPTTIYFIPLHPYFVAANVTV